MDAVELVTVSELTSVPVTVVTTEVPFVLYVALFVNVPLMSAVALDASTTFSKLALTVRDDPLAITKSSPAPLPIVNVWVMPGPDNVTLVLPEIDSRPIVCVGTFVAVVVAPLLKARISLVAGVVLVGVQLVDVAQLADPV